MTHSTTRTLVVVSLALVTLALAWWLWPGHSHDTPSPSPPSPPDSAAERTHAPGDTPSRATAQGGEPGAVAAAALVDRWSGRYTVRFEATVEGPGPDRRPQRGHLELDARLEVVAAPDPGTGWYVARLTQPQLQATASMLAPYGLDPERPDSGLDQRFAFRIDDRGALVERRFDASLPTAGRMLGAIVASGLQLTPPADDTDASAWTVRELGMADTIEVDYSRNAAAVDKRWRVTAPDITSANGGGSHGQAILEHDDDGRLTKARWTLTARTDVAALFSPQAGANPLASAVFTSDTRLTLRRDGDLATDADWARALTPGDMDTAIQAAAAAPGPSRLPEAAPDQLAEAIVQADHEQDFTTRRRLQRQLIAHATHDDALVARFEDELRTPRDPATTRNLIEVLVSTPTPRARRAVASLMSTPETPGHVTRSSARANTLAPAPGNEVIEGLRALAYDPTHPARTDALWALAAQANQLREHDPELSERLDDELVAHATAVLDRLAAEAGPDGELDPAQRAEHNLWMSALGNLGGAHLLEHITPWLDNPDEHVRAESLESLRFVAVDPSPLLLATAIRQDPSSRVRRIAIDTTNYFPRQATQAAVIAALADEESMVRLSAANQLARWSDEAPELLDHVRQAVELEEDGDVRRLLAGFLPENDLGNPDRGRDGHTSDAPDPHDSVGTVEPVLPPAHLGASHEPAAASGDAP